MRRRALFALLPALVLLLAACGSTHAARASEFSAAPLGGFVAVAGPVSEGAQIAGTVGTAALAVAEDDDPHAPGAVDYIATVPENLIWWPWKIVGGTVKGFFDGIGGGFGDDQLPILGVIFSPVNAAVGTLTGFVTGTLSQPGWIGPRDNFGKTLGLPLQRSTPIWWLPK